MEYSEYIALQNKRRKPKRHEESEIQIQYVNWFRMVYPHIILTISMAGVNLPIQVALRLKRMGYLPATPDLMIFRARNGYNGLFIEIKTDNGKPTKDQIAMAQRLTDEGYKSVVCYGLEEAKQATINYLK